MDANCDQVLEAITWTQLAIHNKRTLSLIILNKTFFHPLIPAIVILNVLSFYSPLRDLIRNGVKQGFIQPSNAHLAVFVDGPSDEAEHATFEWGEAALKALDSWQREDTKTVYTYDWSKRMGETEVTIGNNLRNA